MRLYLLDTTPVTAYLFNRPGAVSRIGGWISRKEVVTSALVYGEVIEYIQGFSDSLLFYPERDAQSAVNHELKRIGGKA